MARAEAEPDLDKEVDERMNERAKEECGEEDREGKEPALSESDLSGSEGESLREQQSTNASVQRTLRNTLKMLNSLELEMLTAQFRRGSMSLGSLLGGDQSESGDASDHFTARGAPPGQHPQTVQIQKLIAEGRRRLQRELSKADHRMKVATRIAITGDPEAPVRDYLQEQRRKPVIVKLLDKWSFVIGVTTLVSTEYMVLQRPGSFWIYYSVIMSSMLLTRTPYYRHKKWQYFMLDFCYFAQALNALNAWLLPTSCALFKVNFAVSAGPLCFAVVLWRNSFVFHDFDKITTLSIHVLPGWLNFVNRWWVEDTSSRLASLPSCPMFGLRDFMHTVAVYFLWQVLYFLKTEVFDAHVFSGETEYQTSLRWLAVDYRRPIHQLVLKAMRGCRLMQRDETFNPAELKTKIIFMASQMTYTVIVLLPVPLLYRWCWLHCFSQLAIFGMTLYNGGEYYIDVFSQRYAQQFDKSGGAGVRDPDNDPNPDADAPLTSDGAAGGGPSNKKSD